MRGYLLILSILFVVLAGCGNNSPESSSTESDGGDQMKKELSFETVKMQNAPRDIQATVQQKWLEKSTFTVPSGDDLYIIITRGEMPTGGYSVQVDSIVEEGNQLTVS